MSTSDLNVARGDVAAHAELLRTLTKRSDAFLHEFFDANWPIYIARAPGRLDVMGGIADYSGSLVLELPIREAAIVAVQASGEPGATVRSISDETSEMRQITLNASQWLELSECGYDDVRLRLRQDADAAWAGYVLGSILVLLRETPAKLRGGLRVLIHSSVPEGKGVSSSAALEVATLRSAAALVGVELEGRQLARLGQLAENRVVGAPCGIMDQITAALGHENELLALRCQPDIVEGYVRIPSKIAFWGIDSGIRHAVSGSDYASVRVGAFMGYRILAEAAGLKVRPAEEAGGVVEIEDPLWHGYLANLTPVEFQQHFAARVPVNITGREFLDRYDGTTDGVTRIEPTRTYAVRQPTLHPIEENARVGRFRELLEGGIDDKSLIELGELMHASHASYSACGLGSDGTDLLVRLVREAGPASGLFGAKITGGGSGGTVAILGRANAGEVVDEVAQRYTEISGRTTHIFRGSSPGACATETTKLELAQEGAEEAE